MLQQRRLIDEEHFSVDATLIGANASEKSYQPKADPPQTGSGWGGEVLKRDTHESKTDPEAQLYRKSKRTGFQLAYLGHLVMDNRNGLVVAAAATRVSTGERGAALEMLSKLKRRMRPRTVGADGAYNEKDFRAENCATRASPPMYRPMCAPNERTGWTNLRRTAAYRASQRMRKRIESCFGWLKDVGGQRRTNFRGQARVSWAFTFASAVLNLVRLMGLEAA